MNPYTVFDVLIAEYNLEPLECIFCDSHETSFHQDVCDAYCASCGKWQIEELRKTEEGRDVIKKELDVTEEEIDTFEENL